VLAIRPEVLPVRCGASLVVLLLLCACNLGSDAPKAYQLLLVGGQSNAGRGGEDQTLETRALFPSIYQLAGAGKQGVGWELQYPEQLTQLELAHDGDPGGQFVATMAAIALAGGGNHRDTVIRTDWNGGQPLGSFVEGTGNFTNTLTAVRAIRALTTDRGLECPWYVWIQGESGPHDYTAYYTLLQSYAQSVQSAVTRELNQARAPTFVILQTNTGDWVAPSANPDWSVAMAQWDAARTGVNTIMAGPMYQVPMVIDANDNIHSSSIGRMVLGDLLAAVMAYGPRWRPLQPNGFRVAGNVITLTFDVPGSGLAWDTAWVPATPDYGFKYRDDAGSARILSVRIAGKNAVRIELDRAPSGPNRELMYGMGPSDGRLDGFAEERGQLMSPTKRESYFWRLGYPVPRYVNHYSVRFRLEI
jgi:hypothetical protein